MPCHKLLITQLRVSSPTDYTVYKCLIIKLSIQMVTTVTNHSKAYNGHTWVSTNHRLIKTKAREAIQECNCSIRGMESQTWYPRMHKPRQAIPRCIVKRHQIKEATEAQNFGQTDLWSSRIEASWHNTSDNHSTLGGLTRGIRHEILHRARDQRIIKRYNYSQCLCYDCSTIEGESELYTAVVPFKWHKTLVPLTKVSEPKHIAPLHWCHDVRPCSGTTLDMEQISSQPPIQRLPSRVSSHQPEKWTGQQRIIPYTTLA